MKLFIASLRATVGSLFYAAHSTRPDIAAAVGVVCRYTSNPDITHRAIRDPFLLRKLYCTWFQYILAKEGLRNLDILKHQTIDKQILSRCHSSVKKENLPVAQAGGFSVMFWGCFGTEPLLALEGNQNQHTYKELLEEHLIPEINTARAAFGVNMTFMQYNAPCHKTKKIIEFLGAKGV